MFRKREEVFWVKHYGKWMEGKVQKEGRR